MMIRPSRLVVLIGVSLAACGQPSSPARDREAEPSPVVAPAPAPSRTPVPASHRAFVSVDGVGLHLIDDRGWRPLLDARSPIRDLLALDGRLFVLSAFGVQRLDGGRVWVGTNNGVTIVAEDDGIEEYPIARLGELAGAIGPILVEGHGPPAPPLGRARVGGLTGTIVLREGEATRPLANARVELCNRLPPGPELVPDPTRSPCAGVDSIHALTTDAEGRFEVEGLPIDHYYFGVEIEGRWARGQPKALNMRAGMSGNVGKVFVVPL
jgi:hypothetical protein